MTNDYKNKKEWLKDYQSFLEADDITPPRELSERIFKMVHNEPSVNGWHILSKLALFQAVLGSFSLLACSQFGIGSGPLSETFMRFGHNFCMALCGALFLGLGTLVAGYFLKSAEVKFIRQMGYLPILAMGLLSLGILFEFGAEIIASLAFVWLLGGFVGGLIALEAGWYTKMRWTQGIN